MALKQFFEIQGVFVFNLKPLKHMNRYFRVQAEKALFLHFQNTPWMTNLKKNQRKLIKKKLFCKFGSVLLKLPKLQQQKNEIKFFRTIYFQISDKLSFFGKIMSRAFLKLQIKILFHVSQRF